jgi:ABC-type microcin C transport system permease subunit YejB
VLIYLIRRVALAVVVLIGLLVATFFMIHLVPGDPVRIVLAGRATPDAIARVRHQLALDRPCGRSSRCTSRTRSAVTSAPRSRSSRRYRRSWASDSGRARR